MDRAIGLPREDSSTTTPLINVSREAASHLAEDDPEEV